MAEQRDLKSDLQDNVECAICLSSSPEDPRFLMCGHSFCFNCIKQIHKSDVSKNLYPENKINCPKCRTKNDLPFHGIDGLPIDYATKNILRVLQEHLSKSNNEDQPPPPKAPTKTDNISEQTYTIDQCGFCRDAGRATKAKHYCITCERMMCEECNTRRRKLCVSHPTVSLEGAESMGYILCKCALNRLVTQFCTKCCTPVCAQCALEIHSEHELCDFIKKPEAEASGFVQPRAHDTLKTQRARLQHQLMSMDRAANTSLCENIKREIGRHVDEFVAEIRKEQKTLCQQVDKYRTQVDESLTTMQPTVVSALDSLGKILEKADAFQKPIACDDSITTPYPIPDHQLQKEFNAVQLPATEKFNYNVIFCPEKYTTLGSLDFASLRVTSRQLTDIDHVDDDVSARRIWQNTECNMVYHIQKYREQEIIYTGVEAYRYKLRKVNRIGQPLPVSRQFTQSSDSAILLATDWSQTKVALVCEGRSGQDRVNIHKNEQEIKSFTCPDQETCGIAFTHAGDLIIARSSEDDKRQYFSCYNETGTQLWKHHIRQEQRLTALFQSIDGFTVDLLGRMITVDSTNKQIHIYSIDGERLVSFPDRLHARICPRCVCVDDKGDILVGFSGSINVISRFRMDGTFARHVLRLDDEPRSICAVDTSLLAVGTATSGLLMYEI